MSAGGAECFEFFFRLFADDFFWHGHPQWAVYVFTGCLRSSLFHQRSPISQKSASRSHFSPVALPSGVGRIQTRPPVDEDHQTIFDWLGSTLELGRHCNTKHPTLWNFPLLCAVKTCIVSAPACLFLWSASHMRVRASGMQILFSQPPGCLYTPPRRSRTTCGKGVKWRGMTTQCNKHIPSRGTYLYFKATTSLLHHLLE